MNRPNAQAKVWEWTDFFPEDAVEKKQVVIRSAGAILETFDRAFKAIKHGS